MICNNCQTEHLGLYASGRFCSPKCSRGFSTKAKRQEINVKVSNSLTKGKYIKKTCLQCSNEFSVSYGKRNQKTCSKRCGISLVHSYPEVREKLSRARIEKLEAGVSTGSGIRCMYNTKLGSQVRCDSKLEYACLMFFEETYGVVDIRRSKVRIQYEHEGKIRTFLPDFEVETATERFIVECKSTKASSDMRKKWQYYISSSEIKKNLLLTYAENNNITSFWFTEKTYPKYHSLRLR